MITITELCPPRKIPGQSSLEISFDFNNDVILALKNLSCRYYNDKTKTWEVPVTELAYLLDNLTFMDDITLKLYNTRSKCDTLTEPLSEKEIISFKAKPFQHQIEAVNFGLQHDKWLLLDSMGLGKTLEIIFLAETLKRRGEIEHCLIVCGVDGLRQNWKKEIQKFSNEPCMVLGEKINKKGNITYATVGERAKVLEGEIQEFFVIVNAATLRDDKVIDAFKKSKTKFGMIAVDEIHKFATKSSKQGGNLLKLKSKYKVAATGTPITNSPLSIYIPLSWTENESATLTTYKAQYCKFDSLFSGHIVGFKNLPALRSHVDTCSLRRTLSDVRDDLPPKIIRTELIEMSDEHRKFYESVRDGVVDEAKQRVNLNNSNLLSLVTRLRQATSSPSILTTENITSSKIERCVELAEEIITSGEKVVIMATFKAAVSELALKLKDFEPLVCTGEIKDSIVADNVRRFQEDEKMKVLIGTTDRISTGLTLNAASYLIMLDEQWTAAKNSQAHDRIYRVNNTRPAFITILMCRDTIDERVHEISETKQNLSDYLVDGVDNEFSPSLADEMRGIIDDLVNT